MVPQGVTQRCTNGFGSPGSLLLSVCMWGVQCYCSAELSHTGYCAAQGVAKYLPPGGLAACGQLLQSVVGCG